MTRLVPKTVSVLCYDIARRHAPICRAIHSQDEIEHFVLTQLKRMPAFLAAAIYVVTALFSLTSIFTGARVFHLLSPGGRSAHLLRWAHSPFGPCRELVRFYESLVVVLLYSDLPEPAEALYPDLQETGECYVLH